MKETTKKIISALAGGDSGEIIGLPLAPDLYPRTCLTAAREAFRPYCEFTENSDASAVTIAVFSEHRADSRHIIGSFLNFLLNESASRHLRERTER